MKKLDNNLKLLPNLKNARILKHLTEKEFMDILEICEVYQYDQDEEVIKEGDVSYFLYTVIAGSVSVIIKQEDGNTVKDVYISSLSDGEVFGEAAIFLNMKRTAHVVSNDKAILLKLESDKFMSFIKRYPAAGIKILMVIIYSLLSKIRQVNHELAFERKDYATQNEIDDMINDFFKS